MASILTNNIFKCIILNENDKILIQMSLKLVPRVPTATRASIVCIDSGTNDTIRIWLALAMQFFDILINRYIPVQVMAWCPTGNKPLP